MLLRQIIPVLYGTHLLDKHLRVVVFHTLFDALLELLQLLEESHRRGCARPTNNNSVVVLYVEVERLHV
jgi:hypothetical protein